MRPNRSTRIFISPPRDRDEELVRLASRHGLLEITHVMSALDIGRTAAYGESPPRPGDGASLNTRPPANR